MGLEKMKLITVGKPSLKNAGFLFCFLTESLSVLKEKRKMAKMPFRSSKSSVVCHSPPHSLLSYI